MAKELPYFKFEPGAWDTGNIQLCTHEQKGVFIDLCALYWQRLSDLPYKLAVQKVCGGNATALDSLYDDKIIDIQEGFICIDFLNEQLGEFENTGKTNSENAKKGWIKRKNATAMRLHSDPNAIREEKIKVDKIKVDEKERNLEWFKKQIDSIFLENLKMSQKGKDIDQAILESYAHMAADSIRLSRADSSDCKKLLNTWLSNTKPNGSEPQKRKLAFDL
jgi:hypothetical protein